MKRASRIMVLLILIVVLGACAPGTARFESEQGSAAGFFWGVWHGWIAPVSLVWQLFNRSVRVYEANNSGFWYDLGFYLAIVGGFGGLSFTRRKMKDE